jgi:hypothetical protein
MRAIVIVAFLILILVAIGWLRFFSPDGNPAVEVDTAKIKEDTSSFVEESKKAMGDAADAIDRRIDDDSKVPLAPRTPVDIDGDADADGTVNRDVSVDADVTVETIDR